jgi:hypothetical protein
MIQETAHEYDFSGANLKSVNINNRRQLIENQLVSLVNI